jgi:hypothetical protein
MILSLPAAIAAVGAVNSAIQTRKLKKLAKNRPKYSISPEYSQNQAIAKNQAYGRNRAIMNAEQNIAAQQAMALSAAKRTSASGNSILASLSTNNQNANQAYNDLAGQEASLQMQGQQNLMGANIAMGEERDKEWNYNVNEPYQNQIQQARERRKYANELAMKGVDMGAAFAMQAMNSAGSMIKGGA